MSKRCFIFAIYCIISVLLVQETASAGIITPPADTAETMYFIGISARKSGKQEALKDAEKDAKIRVSGYIAFMVEEKVEDATVFRKSKGKVVENTETVIIASSSYTSAILSEVKTVGEPEITTFRNGMAEAQIVVAVERRLIKKAIDDFNKLRDAMATVRFTDITSGYLIQKGDSIEISAVISANTTISIGAIECVFSYGNIKEVQSLTISEQARFHIDTERLAAGKHTAVLELQLNKLLPGMINVRRSIVFDVIPLNTAQVVCLDENAKSIAQKIRDIIQKQGILLVESGAAYLAEIQVTLNEKRTNNYFIVEPTVTINIELERDGTPLVTYNKKYGESRHITRAEALQRAYRNIENDLGGNFAEQVKGIGK
jgi:hypothetical protein